MTGGPSFSDRVAAGYGGLSPQLRRAADFVAATLKKNASGHSMMIS